MKKHFEQMKSGSAVASAKNKKQKLTLTKEVALPKVSLAAGLNEIDNLFDNLKKNKEEKVSGLSAKKKAASLDKLGSDDDISSQPVKLRRIEVEENQPHGIIKSNNPRVIISPEAPVERIDPESGYKVYKAHILKVGEGGGTDLCPFDCDCCF